jgi:EF hand domain-containing protein
MKRVLLATTLLLTSAGYALAGAGAGSPTTPADAPSGRPTAILDDAKCSNVWSLTQRQGDALTEGEAAPFIVNFKLVDTNGDGKISEAEFKDGCKNGLVQQASAGGQQQPSGKTAPMGNSAPSPAAPE